MATNRSLVFANGQIYHVFNRGIERRTVFTGKREYERMLDSIWLYRYAVPGINLSRYFALSAKEKELFKGSLGKKNQQVSLIAYCLMPNHFHFVVRQEEEYGVSRFIANITNSYTKYFNLKQKREGPLFQGTFKAVIVETEEQLLHLTRYVHLNPVTSFHISLEELETYPWSSLFEYITKQTRLCSRQALQDLIPLKKYMNFVSNQDDYIQDFEKIAHVAIDEKQ